MFPRGKAVVRMKVSAIQKLRRKLARDEPVYGLWVTLESASITEMAVALGLDWVVIDAEHGHLDWHDILEHLRATVRSDTTALVRVTELNIGQIKRALDIGADGVVVPWIETADQLRQAVAFAHYPPEGLRGMGGERPEQGFRFLGVGMDAGLLLRSVTGALTEMGRSTSISASLAPEVTHVAESKDVAKPTSVAASAKHLAPEKHMTPESGLPLRAA